MHVIRRRCIIQLIGFLILIPFASTGRALAWSEEEVVGEVPYTLFGGTNALSGQTTLGVAAADALCYVTGAQIAVVNGGDLSGGLVEGERTYKGVLNAFSNDREIAVAQITPADLRTILEVGVSHSVLDTETLQLDSAASLYEGFPQVSGFWFQYDLPASIGDRIMRIRLDDLGTLDLTDDATTISIAATAYMFSGAYGYPAIEDYTLTGMTLSEAMADYIASGEGSQMGRSDNMSVAGAANETIVSMLPSGFLLLLVLACLIIGLVRTRNKRNNSRFYGETYEESHHSD